jgi:hypothetical protein
MHRISKYRKENNMQKVLSITIFLVIMSFIASCGTTSSNIPFHELTFSPEQEDAIIYVYRLPSFVGSAVSWSVAIDEKEVAILKQNAYAVFRTTPGEHLITVGKPGNIPTAVVEASTRKLRTFTATPRGVYFFRCKGFTQYFVTREEAMKEIVSMKYDMGL